MLENYTTPSAVETYTDCGVVTKLQKVLQILAGIHACTGNRLCSP